MAATQVATKEDKMIAAGPFDVKLMPQPPGEDAVLGRLTLDKKFHGDLEATSKGQMLAFSSSVKDSAGYGDGAGRRHPPGQARHVRSAAQRHDDSRERPTGRHCRA